jgi:hypothetical protein
VWGDEWNTQQAWELHKWFWLENLKGAHLLEHPTSSLEDNIKMGLKHIGFDGVDCIYLAKGADEYWTVFNIALNFLFP